MSEEDRRISRDHAEPEEEEDGWSPQPGRTLPSVAELLSRPSSEHYGPHDFPFQKIFQADDQVRASRDTRSNSEREPSVERCPGCNEAWRRPIPGMIPKLPPIENNADSVRPTNNVIDRLGGQSKKVDDEYKDWEHRHSRCIRPTSRPSSPSLVRSYAPSPASPVMREGSLYSKSPSTQYTAPFEWVHEKDPSERRKIINRLAQQRFRAKAKEQKEEVQREVENHRLAATAYVPPDAAELEDHHTLSGLPWGGLSLTYVKTSGQNRSSQYTKYSGRSTQDSGIPSTPGTEHSVAFSNVSVIHRQHGKRGLWDRDDMMLDTGKQARIRQRTESQEEPLRGEALRYRRSSMFQIDAKDLFAHGDDSATEHLASDTSESTDEEVLQDSEGRSECGCKSLELKHMLPSCRQMLRTDLESVQSSLPKDWKWDLQYQPGPVGREQFGVWTFTPYELEESVLYPLTIAGEPVVLPVESRWPPTGGVNPPPDPRPLSPMDCRATPSMDIVKDIFVTFEGCIGFYLLINGTLQLIVSENFDIASAASHLPHKYGGLKISYIRHDVQPTMLPSKNPPDNQMIKARSNSSTPKPTFSDLFRPFRPTSVATTANAAALQMNDFIEARGSSSHKQKYSGRIGLQVAKDGSPFLLMSSHVITEAMLSRSFLGTGRVHLERLENDWNDHVEIWAANERIGRIEKSFDVDVGLYPNGFKYDCTLIKPHNASLIQDVKSPVADMGWLNHDSWSSLRQRTSSVKILGRTESHRNAKSLKCHLCSDVLIVGEGIFLNQTMAAGKPLKDHSRSTWESLVSRAVLYRVSPDFDPPTGYSGIALYAEGTREDGTQGPGIVGFQSFVQTSEGVQSFEMEGPPLEQRLRRGRIAFYGAFQVPDELRQNYSIM